MPPNSNAEVVIAMALLFSAIFIVSSDGLQITIKRNRDSSRALSIPEKIKVAFLKKNPFQDLFSCSENGWQDCLSKYTPDVAKHKRKFWGYFDSRSNSPSQDLSCSTGWRDCLSKYTPDVAEYKRKFWGYFESSWKSPSSDFSCSNGWRDCLSKYKAEYKRKFWDFVHEYATSTTDCYLGGYKIHAVNLGVSPELSNIGVMKITLETPGPVDRFEQTVKGNEIEFKILSGGKQRSAIIIAPEGTRMEDQAKIDRRAEAIYVTVQPQGSVWNLFGWMQGG